MLLVYRGGRAVVRKAAREMRYTNAHGLTFGFRGPLRRYGNDSAVVFRPVLGESFSASSVC